MVTLIKKARFRIYINDLQNKTARSISLANHSDEDIDTLKKKIIECLEAGEMTQ